MSLRSCPDHGALVDSFPTMYQVTKFQKGSVSNRKDMKVRSPSYSLRDYDLDEIDGAMTTSYAVAEIVRHHTGVDLDVTELWEFVTGFTDCPKTSILDHVKCINNLLQKDEHLTTLDFRRVRQTGQDLRECVSRGHLPIFVISVHEAYNHKIMIPNANGSPDSLGDGCLAGCVRGFDFNKRSFDIRIYGDNSLTKYATTDIPETLLEDKDLFACFWIAHTTSGKSNNVAQEDFVYVNENTPKRTNIHIPNSRCLMSLDD